jgi:hypothetical protein
VFNLIIQADEDGPVAIWAGDNPTAGLPHTEAVTGIFPSGPEGLDNALGSGAGLVDTRIFDLGTTVDHEPYGDLKETVTGLPYNRDRTYLIPSVAMAALAALVPMLGGPAAALDEAAILQEHLDSALARFESEGLTNAQARRVALNPNLEAAFRGERIDTFFKESVAADPRLQHLEITPRFEAGPDVYDAESGQWWDVTTSGQWGAHVRLYSTQYGTGTPLLYQ